MIDVIRRQGHYALAKDGRLFAQYGTPHMYLAGSVSHPDNMEIAIDNHEEEVRVLWEDAKEEFGL